MSRKNWTLLAVCVATFMLLIDVTIVNVALPDIQEDLDASLSSLQWVVDAYALTLASFLLVFGSIGDRLGRKRVFSLGFALFIVASTLCGLAGDATLLNLARGLQGAGAAAMFATALALIAQEFEGRERANAIGIWGATVGGAVAIGPLVGGVLTESLGWEWIFFVNVPIGLGAMVLTERKLVNVKATDPQPIDGGGLVTFSAALFLLIFGLIRGNAEGWGSPEIVLCLVSAAVLLAAFVAIELRRENAMLDLSLFRNPSFTGVSIVAFCLSAGMFAMFLYLTLYMQDVLELSPLDAGLRFLPLTLLSFLVAPLSARLSNRIPFRALMGTGMILTGLGLVLMNGIDAARQLDHAAGRLPPRRHRHRPDEPRDRLGCDRRRGPATGGDGLGDQLHLPPGRASRPGSPRSARSSRAASPPSSPPTSLRPPTSSPMPSAPAPRRAPSPRCRRSSGSRPRPPRTTPSSAA